MATKEESETEAESEDLSIDKEAALKLPAVLIDTWFMTGWRGYIRLAVGEMSADAPPEHWRAAFVMETRDAERLGRQLLRFAEGRKRKMERRKQEEAEEG